jgi:hypothetical protein
MTPGVYQSDPDARSDDEFVAGEVGYLVAGNRGRLLDPRRTPVHVVDIDIDVGFFTVEIDAFEDAGAHWQVPLEQVSHYQFTRDAARADAPTRRALAAAAVRHDLTIRVEPGPSLQAAGRERLAAARQRAAAWLAWRWGDAGFDPAPHVVSRAGSPKIQGLLIEYHDARGLAEIERRLSQAFVSNPGTGDVVRDHLVVIAELGLGSYFGPPLRDPNATSGEWSRARRAEHVLARAGFTQALWQGTHPPLPLVYRGMSYSGQLEQRNTALVSATFARDVAQAHFKASRREVGVLYQRELPIDRLFMTFIETEAMNERYREAEAVLIGSRGAPI